MNNDIQHRAFVHENLECVECGDYGMMPDARDITLEGHIYIVCDFECQTTFLDEWFAYHTPRPRRRWAVRLLEKALAA